MKILRYHITLDEAALFTTFAGDPNTLVSHDHIPGSVLRGMLIAATLRKQGQDFSLDAAHPEDRRLFFSGETRYLNAYPLIEGQRSLPVPASWQTDKYESKDSGIIFDTAIKRGIERRKPKAVKGFVLQADSSVYLMKPNRIINVHSQRGRYTNRKCDENTIEQAVFRYDALAAGQSFEAIILCDRDDDALLLANLLSETERISIGGARTAGYGLCHIDNILIEEDWQEAPRSSNEPLLLTLLSDMILRDKQGNYSPSPDAFLDALEPYKLNSTIEVKSMDTVMVGGFNRKWGLPLPQVPAIAAGSVFQLHLSANENLDELLWYGLGERLLDGYGRIAIGWQSQEKLEILEPSAPAKIPAEKPELSEISKRIWSGDEGQSGLLQRIREQQIDSQFVGIVYSAKYSIRGRITKSQLARLRLAIANELRKPNPTKAVLQTFLNEIKGKAAARQIDESWIGKERLKNWLENPDFGDDVPSSIQKRDPYLLQLVDAALERAHKEKSREEG